MLIKNNKFIGKLINIILGLCVTLFSVGLSVILVLNLTPVYKVAIKKFDITKWTGLQSNDLMINYKQVINYLRNPFIEKLRFKDFSMSLSGEIHFKEVKDIFINLYIIMFISIIILITFKLIRKISIHIKLERVLNYSSNIILILFGIITATIIIDFSKAFVLFHNIFFNNSYWIFDPITDPIINALPEELFMIYALIVIMFLLAEAVVFKYIYYKNKSKE